MTTLPKSVLMPLRGPRSGIRTKWLPSLGDCLYNTPNCLSFSRLYSELKFGVPAKDNRVRLSDLWVPTGGIAATDGEDSHSKLVRAGFLRQAHSGLFHMLPLGRRVQDKLEALIDKHMSRLRASKLALSSISSEELWTKSGRLNAIGSEIFKFSDRRDTGYLLSPTHEEEITSLVASTVKSYKELPVRLYQISRKYRDELRPRQGLLRSREFVMKDLYTFDYNSSSALETYHEVREVYAKLFGELKIPYLVAEAASGDMGGNLSHEFHFPTAKGEDHVISCNSCDYVANEELAESGLPRTSESEKIKNLEDEEVHFDVWTGISRDRHTLINVWYPSTIASADTPKHPEVNFHAVKTVIPDFDPSIEDPALLWSLSVEKSLTDTAPGTTDLKLVNLIDCRIPQQVHEVIKNQSPAFSFRPVKSPVDLNTEFLAQDPSTGQALNLLRIKDGDPCARCSDGKLKVQKAIELGHTFFLGTRYSEPLNATISIPQNILANHESSMIGSNAEQKVHMQMGCHGIGVSRMIGAVVDSLADEKGLNWPRVMAPFEVVVIPSQSVDDACFEVYDTLSEASKTHKPRLDIVLDDRAQGFPWKMRDADLIGYPIIVVVGRRWKAERICEIQCRRLGVREDIPLDEMQAFIEALLEKL